MPIIAYIYDADMHCVECTQTRHANGGFTVRCDGPAGEDADENDIPYGATNRKGNLIHPVFETDEGQLDENGDKVPVCCGTCCKLI